MTQLETMPENMANVAVQPDPSWDFNDMIQAFSQAPSYHLIFEVLLIMWIIHLLFTKSYKPERTSLTDKEKEELISTWEPEPLVPEVPDDDPVLQIYKNNVVSSKPGKEVTVDGKECVNMATLNFLGMVGKQEIEDVAIKALRKYGVGSCGPRGFYGTVDVHLDLEDELAKFMQVEEAIIYSYGFASVASAIPAYAKRGDIIYVDEGVSFAIQKGLQASRSVIKYFKHNDMDDLERILKEQEREDAKNPKKARVTRKFIVVEGIYTKYGDIVPLPKLVELKWKYKVRIFMDESISFGTMGQTGRGITEHFNIPIDEIDHLSASMENSLGSVGGFCCGKMYVVDHQRLSGVGYCFSASQPPMLAVAGSQALRILKGNPNLTLKLKNNSIRVHEKLKNVSEIRLQGASEAPIKFVMLKDFKGTLPEAEAVLHDVVKEARRRGYAFTVASYLDEERIKPPPSIRVAVTTEMSDYDIDLAVDVLEASFKNVLKNN